MAQYTHNAIVLRSVYVLVKSIETAKRQINEAWNAPAKEHVENTFRAGLSLVPALGYLVDTYFPKAAERRMKAMLLHLSESIATLKEEQAKKVLTDDFAFLFARCLRNVAVEHQAAKQKAYTAILEGALTVDLDAGLQEAYLKKVEDLTSMELELLRVIWINGRPDWECYKLPEMNDVVLPGDRLCELVKDRSPRLLFTLICQLEQHGILWRPNGLSGFSQLPEPMQFGLLDVAISDFGLGFLSFIMPNPGVPDYLIARLGADQKQFIGDSLG